MSRSKRNRSPAETAAPSPADEPTTFNTARIAEEIGIEALGMAKWAHAAGLSTLGFLLETVALEAGAQAAAMQWPSDAPER